MLKDLIREYKKSLRLLRQSNVSPIHSKSMISDTVWAIQYMEIGRMPGNKWTVARWSRDKREVAVDPFLISRFVKNSAPVKSAPDWMVQLLESLMSSLTAKEKEAFKLVRGHCYSFAQAAQLMGCNKGSVQNLVRRAEKKIALVVRKQTISERELFKTGGEKF
jgi:RNA polymerase sigma-70 factor (ECF subfamily)